MLLNFLEIYQFIYLISVTTYKNCTSTVNTDKLYTVNVNVKNVPNSYMGRNKIGKKYFVPKWGAIQEEKSKEKKIK